MSTTPKLDKIASPPRKPKGRATGENTADRKGDILNAAERLFAQHGFHGVSIRDIADEAGVQFALVGYYYGPKLNLYHDIFRQRAGYVQDRLAFLAAAQLNAAPGELLEKIVEAFVLPVLEVARDPKRRNFLRLIQRGMDEQLAEDEELLGTLFNPMAHAFIDAFTAAIPGASRGDAACAYQFALGSLLHHVGDRRIEVLSRGAYLNCDAQASPLLLKFITAGIRGVFARPVH
ncbi:MAG: TetR family transcriptional regulator [Pseudomonadota bacterium]